MAEFETEVMRCHWLLATRGIVAGVGCCVWVWVWVWVWMWVWVCCFRQRIKPPQPSTHYFHLQPVFDKSFLTNLFSPWNI